MFRHRSIHPNHCSRGNCLAPLAPRRRDAAVNVALKHALTVLAVIADAASASESGVRSVKSHLFGKTAIQLFGRPAECQGMVESAQSFEEAILPRTLRSGGPRLQTCRCRIRVIPRSG